jgi:signal peptidase I
LNSENQVVSSYGTKRQKGHIKPQDLNLIQPPALSPQSSNLSPHNFVRICTELLHQGHQVKFKAPGHSMYPTICDGDLITVGPMKPADICVGDIILYHHENGVVAHRVINIQAPQSSVPSTQHLFLLRGDAAIKDDAPVSSERILGKVVSIERNGRRFDPYRLRIKLHYKTRRTASRIKRLLIRSN